MTVQELNLLQGENIRRYRKLKGWTQMRLSKETGISAVAISDFENGKHFVGGKSWVLIAYALGIEPYQLFYPNEGKPK
jgi:transcriptional regulator with XRE-family HTH domain